MLNSVFQEKGKWAILNLDSGKRIIGKIIGIHVDYVELERRKHTVYVDYSKMEYVSLHVDEPGVVPPDHPTEISQ